MNNLPIPDWYMAPTWIPFVQVGRIISWAWTFAPSLGEKLKFWSEKIARDYLKLAQEQGFKWIVELVEFTQENASWVLFWKIIEPKLIIK
jgi:hypothetical protein